MTLKSWHQISKINIKRTHNTGGIMKNLIIIGMSLMLFSCSTLTSDRNISSNTNDTDNGRENISVQSKNAHQQVKSVN